MRLSDLSVLSPALPTFVLAFAGVLGACLGCLVGRLAWHVARGEIAREGHIRCVERDAGLCPLVRSLLLAGRSGGMEVAVAGRRRYAARWPGF